MARWKEFSKEILICSNLKAEDSGFNQIMNGNGFVSATSVDVIGSSLLNRLSIKDKKQRKILICQVNS